MSELEFKVLIDSSLGRECQGVVAFGDFEVPEDDLGAAYSGDRAVSGFYLDLVMGRPLPLTFVTREVSQVGTLVAVALFLHRDLALAPAMASVIAAAELVDRFKLVGLAHVEPDLARFFRLVTKYLPGGLARREQQERLATAVGWVRDYVRSGVLPALPHEPPPPKVLDRGTNGFVLAESPSWAQLDLGWVELFRQGYLRGLLLGAERDERIVAMAARKSSFLAYDLKQAQEILNEAERAMGEPPEWALHDNWLHSPPNGTLMRPDTLIQVMLHV